VIQHEFDHLNGVLFIDRVGEDARRELQDGIDELDSEYARARAAGEIADDQTLATERAAWEKRYC
jgi:peptide deformylase